MLKCAEITFFQGQTGNMRFIKVETERDGKNQIKLCIFLESKIPEGAGAPEIN
jgi:hypothetical protein